MYEDLAKELLPFDEHPLGEEVWYAGLRNRVQQALETVHKAAYAMGEANGEAAEREACAKEVELHCNLSSRREHMTGTCICKHIAAAIRARGLDGEGEE